MFSLSSDSSLTAVSSMFITTPLSRLRRHEGYNELMRELIDHVTHCVKLTVIKYMANEQANRAPDHAGIIMWIGKLKVTWFLVCQN